jgi:hypothetical protein
MTLLASVAHAQTVTLRQVLREHRLDVTKSVLPHSDTTLMTWVIDSAPDMFAIAYVLGRPGDYLPFPDSLHLAIWNRTSRQWIGRAIDPTRYGVLADDMRSLMAIHHTRQNFFIDTHINPSAGRVLVVSRDLDRVVTLPGWVARVLPNDIVVFYHNRTQFAPTRWVELWTWDDNTRRTAQLYPSTPRDSLRQAYIDSFRAKYKRVGEAWLRAHNHHMNPELFDTKMNDTFGISPSGRTITFIVNYGGGRGPQDETPPTDVFVVCTGVGTAQPRCKERLYRDMPGYSTMTPMALIAAVAAKSRGQTP